MVLFGIARQQLLTQLTILLAFSPLCFAQSPSYETSPQFDAICSSHGIPDPTDSSRIDVNQIYQSMIRFLVRPEVRGDSSYNRLIHTEREQYEDILKNESNIDYENVYVTPSCSGRDSGYLCSISSCEVSGSLFCNQVSFKTYVAAKRIAVFRHSLTLKRLFSLIIQNGKSTQIRQRARRFRSQVDILYKQLLELPESFGFVYDCPRN